MPPSSVSENCALSSSPETTAPRILALANQKGGVGKTTTAVNLAAALAARYRILLIDLDPQGNASTGLGVDRATRRTGTYAMLVEGRPVAEVARPTRIPNLSVIPADPDLAGGELELVDLEGREHRLRRCRLHELIRRREPIDEATDRILAMSDGVLHRLAVATELREG